MSLWDLLNPLFSGHYSLINLHRLLYASYFRRIGMKNKLCFCGGENRFILCPDGDQ